MRTIAAALLLAACSKSNLPPAVCTAGTSWSPGTQAFRDATTDWGLDQIDAEGVRISVADIDNDGWPDIIVRKVGAVPDQGPAGGARSIWLLRNTGHKSFEDVTYSSGILQTRQTQNPPVGRPGEVVAFADVDNDGDLDAYTGLSTVDGSKSLGETSEIMLNDGHGHFSLGSAGSDVRRASDVDAPAGASFVDFDHDGNIDLWVPESDYTDNTGEVLQQNRLYKGDGQGNLTFWNGTAQIQTTDWSPTMPDWSDSIVQTLNSGQGDTVSWSALACDLNGDGFPELLAGSYGRSPNQLLQGVSGANGVTYENRSVDSGYAYDNDFVYTDNQFFRCWCMENASSPLCSGVPPSSVDCSTPNWDPTVDTEKFRLGGNNATALCADLGNDGRYDLITHTIKHWWAGEGSDAAEILVNNGASDVQFTRPGRESMGIVVPHDSSDWDEGIMTGAVVDFDNDGMLDFYWGASDYPGNRGLLYHQKSKLQFESVPIAQGIDLHRSHGVVVADFDRDGDLDVIAGTSTARCNLPDSDAPCYPKPFIHLFENVIGQGGNWVQLKLEGAAGTNRAAIGALVQVTAGGVTQSKQVDGGHGHFGMQDDLVQHFGLGTACEATVTIRWPNAKMETQTFTVTAGHRFHVIEGKAPTVAD